jgi:hypothetical protein
MPTTAATAAGVRDDTASGVPSKEFEAKAGFTVK